MTEGTVTTVTALPKCDICVHVKHLPAEEAKPAYVDGATIGGPWAYMCFEHYAYHGIGLGVGRGQRLVLEPTE